MRPRFTADNTEGFSEVELAQLNARFIVTAHSPPEAWSLDSAEWKSWRDYCAEQVLATFAIERVEKAS